jgi:NADH dehydrogenase (ubiquinone) 1 alpha/beta subcomplex 1, acyl-carrier protein
MLLKRRVLSRPMSSRGKCHMLIEIDCRISDCENDPTMLSSTIRLLMRSGTLVRPLATMRPLSFQPTLIHLKEKPKLFTNEIARRSSHVHYNYGMIESRVMLLLRLFDKIDADKIQLDSRFVQDLGLDSLDIVEITAACEDEFWTEVADCDSDRFLTPRHIIQYFCDKFDVYEHVQPISAGKEYMEEAKAAEERAHHH